MISRQIFFSLSSVAGFFFGRFLGSEGIAIMNTGLNLLLFGIAILGFSFLFRLYCVRLQKKYNFRVVFFLYLSIVFVISFFFYFLRIYLLSSLGLLVGFSLASVLIFCVSEHSLPAPSVPSNSGNTPGSFDWRSFEERVLLEDMPEESGSSVNGPSNTEAAGSSETSGDPDRNPEEVLKKRDELHLLVREQLNHYCERGRPKWQLSRSEEEKKAIYDEPTQHIISSLEIEPSVSEHQMWLNQLRQEPTTLFDLFREYK
jgi:hypothetical protein